MDTSRLSNEVLIPILVGIQDRYLLKPDTIERALKIIYSREIRPSSSTPGNYLVKSQSQAHTDYIVTPERQMCGCPAGRNGRLCVHLVAAYIYVAIKAQETQESNEIIKQREENAKALNRKTKKLEWSEELDYPTQEDYYKEWDDHDRAVHTSSQSELPFEEWVGQKDQYLTDLYPKRPLYTTRHEKETNVS